MGLETNLSRPATGDQLPRTRVQDLKSAARTRAVLRAAAWRQLGQKRPDRAVGRLPLHPHRFWRAQWPEPVATVLYEPHRRSERQRLALREATAARSSLYLWFVTVARPLRWCARSSGFSLCATFRGVPELHHRGWYRARILVDGRGRQSWSHVQPSLAGTVRRHIRVPPGSLLQETDLWYPYGNGETQAPC